MFVHLSIHRPKPGREQELIDSMHRFGDAADGTPGLRSVHTLKDLRTGTLVGLAIWEDDASWESGVGAMRAAVADDPFDEWEQGEPESFALVEV